MSNQHNLRTKYIPFRPDSLIQSNLSTTIQNSQSVSSTPVIGHVYQNTWIAGGLISQKVPIVAQSIQVIGYTSHIVPSNSSFVPAVNLIGCGVTPVKIVQRQFL